MGRGDWRPREADLQKRYEAGQRNFVDGIRSSGRNAQKARRRALWEIARAAQVVSYALANKGRAPKLKGLGKIAP